jgi:hypothetical protein
MLPEILMLAIFIIGLVALYVLVIAILQDNEKYCARIRELSNMLQIAEYQTGRPYYTASADDRQPVETPNWLYKHIREKMIYSQHDTQGTQDT